MLECALGVLPETATLDAAAIEWERIGLLRRPIALPVEADWVRLGYGFVHLLRRPLSDTATAFVEIMCERERAVDGRVLCRWCAGGGYYTRV